MLALVVYYWHYSQLEVYAYLILFIYAAQLLYTTVIIF